MSGKIVLYERENYKQARKNLLLYNFSDVLYRENFLEIRGNFSEQISAVLIIPKLLSELALTNANAKSTLCAERGTALTRFAFLELSCKRAQ